LFQPENIWFKTSQNKLPRIINICGKSRCFWCDKWFIPIWTALIVVHMLCLDCCLRILATGKCQILERLLFACFSSFLELFVWFQKFFLFASASSFQSSKVLKIIRARILCSSHPTAALLHHSAAHLQQHHHHHHDHHHQGKY